jgi:hypothetical protein
VRRTAARMGRRRPQPGVVHAARPFPLYSGGCHVTEKSVHLETSDDIAMAKVFITTDRNIKI